MLARLRLENVGKRYGDHVVLDAVDLAVRAGDLVLVRGPSGSGKTTLLNVLGLLEPPSTGRVLVDDADAAGLADDARARVRLHAIGHVFQSHNMIPALTLEENVLLPMRLAGRADASRARQLLADVGLADHAEKRPNEVSIGQRQRAAFARALANAPGLLIADEPTASLDDDNARIVTERLVALAQSGTAVVVASHDARVAKALAGARVVDVERGGVTEAVLAA